MAARSVGLRCVLGMLIVVLAGSVGACSDQPADTPTPSVPYNTSELTHAAEKMREITPDDLPVPTTADTTIPAPGGKIHQPDGFTVQNAATVVRLIGPKKANGTADVININAAALEPDLSQSAQSLIDGLKQADGAITVVSKQVNWPLANSAWFVRVVSAAPDATGKPIPLRKDILMLNTDAATVVVLAGSAEQNSSVFDALQTFEFVAE